MAAEEAAEKQALANFNLRPGGNAGNTHFGKLKYSQHARARQTQRSITHGSINNAVQHGQQFDCKDAKICTDQNVKVIVSNDTNTVVTVNKNTRNTRFQLADRTQERAKSLLYKVNKYKNNSAMCDLADLYRSGELGESDVKKAFDLYERSANMGNSHAMCKISEMYESGELGVPDLKLANVWMKRAAVKNNTFATSIIGQRLLSEYLQQYPKDSKIVKRTSKKRMEEEILFYLNKAADKGATRAIWQLANIYEKGLLGEKDLSKAIELYVEAGKMGSPGSLDSLHKMTLERLFSICELEDLLDSLLYMTDVSIGMAFKLGRHQLSGILGYNPVRGFKIIEQVALKQYDDAMLKLAECYRDGICITNLKLAQYWFNKLQALYEESAAAGNVNSLRKLANLYLNGTVGNIDLEKAESYFKESIEKSPNPDPDWVYMLGRLYLKGRLGDKPLDIGIKLIAQAIRMWQFQAAAKNTSVYYELGEAYAYIHDEKKAVYWLSKAPHIKANVEAQILLAKICLNDLSKEKNISLGLEILENIILKQGVDPSTAFDSVGFTLNDQTMLWLQSLADKVTEPVTGFPLSPCIANEDFYLRTFQEFVISTVAKAYEKGELNGIIDHNLASKYYFQLFVNFKSTKARRSLTQMFLSQNLPAEHCEVVKNWILEIPAFFEKLIDGDESSGIDYKDFCYFVSILGKMYQSEGILPRNIQEATKWLYLDSYFPRADYSEEQKRIKEDLKNLPPLDSNRKAQIVSELSKITKHLKTTSPFIYQIMSRILGDIFYDNKIVDQNIEQSIYWYTESANLSNGRAAFSLGRIFQIDKKNIDASIKWYKLSLQLGHTEALKVLKEMTDEQMDASLIEFLDKYVHRPTVNESEFINIKPSRSLEGYPKTAEEMFELGKSSLKSGNKHDNLNAAHWFRTAMYLYHIDAAIELCKMYKSGILGVNLVPCAENLCPDILEMCYSELKDKTNAQSEDDISDIVKLLNNVSSVLEMAEMTTAKELNQKIETVIKQKESMNTEVLGAVMSDLKQVIQEMYSQTSVSATVDVYLLSDEFSDRVKLDL